MSFHQQKTESLLAKYVGEFLSREAGPMSLITVTHISFNEKTKKAIVFITVLPESQEKAALAFTERKRSELREYIRDKSKLGILPVFDFIIDVGEKNRQMVDNISAQDNMREKGIIE